MRLMTLCLVAYGFARYRLYLSLEYKNMVKPNQLGKLIKTQPTVDLLTHLIDQCAMLMRLKETVLYKKNEYTQNYFI